eukprot:symbB.v1.2.010611.t1/scaffold696.1/size260109/4
MDIRIEALDGPVPAGETFVSMRIGDYQKQSRLGCTKSYRFPQDDGNGFARVEVFQRIGHVSISLEKLRASDQDVQVPLESADVKFLPMRIGMQSSAEKGHGKVKTRLDSAQRYLSQHQLEEIIADAMREVIHEKPEDPHTFLSNQILKHAKKPQFLPPLRNEKELPPRPSSRNQKPNMSEKLPPIGGRELASLREEARDVLLQSAKDGSLAKALVSASSENVDMGELRKEAATALLNAAKDGTLDAALQETRTPKDNELEELRQQARATLLQGARDGSLQDALKSTKDEVSVDSVRMEARDALLRSAQDGSLATALQQQAHKGNQQKVEELRAQARDALLKASMNGGLEQVLAKGKAEKKANQAAAEPEFKFKPSVGSWLQKKPHQVPKPWYYRRVSVAEEDEKVVKGLQAVIAEKDSEIAALKAQLLQTGMDVASPKAKAAESAAPIQPPKAESSKNDNAKSGPSLKDFRSYNAEHVQSFGSGLQETLYAKFPQPKPAPKATVPKVEEAPVKFALRPSVGTWLTPKLKPTGATAAPAPSVAPTASGKASTPFALKPSVGTWLTFKINNDRPKSASILDRTHSKQLAMDQEELIKGYQKEIKKRDQEIENLKSSLKP